MDYKKKYEDALERAIKWTSQPTVWSSDDICQKIFPELKESEDERIRKELIEHIKTNCESGFILFQKFSSDNVIAWLEKQGKRKFKVGDIISNGKVIYRVDGITKNYIGQDCYFLVNVESEKNGTRYLIKYDSEGKTSHMGEITWLCEQVDESFEKQGEQSNPYSGVSFEYHGHTWGMCARDNGVDILLDKQLFTHLEIQGEQKSTDKIEPKFKVGDWVIYECGEDSAISQIKNIVYGTYEFTDNSTLNVVDENTLRLWTIQDAKDGDVLATKDIVFIFKHMDKTGLSLCKSYCEVVGNSKLGLGFDFSINGVHPATKEQRDLLFSKMKEAGYEWDAEKKELRKIEQKPWSEEDEKMLDRLIKHFDWGSDYRFDKNDCDEAQNWLKSLKERIEE